MSYGIQVRGMFGMITVENQIIPVIRARYNVNGISGSINLPADVGPANAVAYASIPNVLISISGASLSWSILASSSQSFIITVLRFP